jgi:phosphoribosylformimino-5-aminoimidazole carboxamide ribotide isomerase
MIQIIPSIAIHRSRVVKLIHDLSDEKIYAGSPVDVARKFEDHGIEVVHLIDLEGAAEGSAKNIHVIEAIVNNTNLKVDFTGGLLTDGDILKAFEYGASYLTVASAAVLDKELFSSWVVSYGREKITLGADTSEGKIFINGWQKKTNIDLYEHIGYFYAHGLKYVKTTDINRDGLLEGPSFSMYEEIKKRFPNISVLAAGGVRSVDDIQKLQDIGVFAVIIGRAIYEGKLSLKDIESFLVKK